MGDHAVTITIVDYGVGNLGSISNMLRNIGIPSVVASAPAGVATAGRLILPGVGGFDRAAQRLDESGLGAALLARAKAGVPLLGVCLGMQLLGNSSEEGQRSGLALVDADFLRISVPRGGRLKVPHMGWNEVHPNEQSWILAGVPSPMRFYFAHSYAARCADPTDVIATADYGGRLVAIFGRGNVVGAQFHPEKSHAYGMQLLKNFATWDAE